MPLPRAGMRIAKWKDMRRLRLLESDLQVWLLKGRAPSAELYRSMWEKAMDDMRKMLVRTPEGSNLTYVGDTAGPM